MNDSTERLGGQGDQATLAYVRLGVPPQENLRYQDLEAARVLIDALGGMLEAVEGQLGPGAEELYQALAALRMTYASISGQRGGPPPGQGRHSRRSARSGPAACGSPGRTDKTAPPWRDGAAARSLRRSGLPKSSRPKLLCLCKRSDVRGLRALGAVGDLELDGLPFGQGLVTIDLNCREVHEHVIAALPRDEPVALLVAEPLDGAFWQRASLLSFPDRPDTCCSGIPAGRADCNTHAT